MSWSSMAAEVAGKHKAHCGTECQDAVSAWVSESVGFAALADGLGSCPLSRVGARAVIEIAEKHLPQLFLGSDLMNKEIATKHFKLLLDSIREFICRKASEDGYPINHYHTTMLVMVLFPEWIAAASIGDAFLTVRFSHENDFTLLVPPAPSHYVDETATVLLDDAVSHLRVFFESRHVQTAFGSSDGLTQHGLVFQNNSWVPHQPFFRNVLERRLCPPATEQALVSLLDHPQINTDVESDDKSVFGFFAVGPSTAP